MVRTPMRAWVIDMGLDTHAGMSYRHESGASHAAGPQCRPSSRQQELDYSGYPCGHGLPTWIRRVACGWSAVLTVLAAARSSTTQSENSVIQVAGHSCGHGTPMRAWVSDIDLQRKNNRVKAKDTHADIGYSVARGWSAMLTVLAAVILRLLKYG
ncbi:hypothetical protein C8Q74DRAFT_1216030 [Fomes fomentarius]|nr:hypothetical protein C8Q74DRAFT_1216030 [Fomes fomentarius]